VDGPLLFVGVLKDDGLKLKLDFYYGMIAYFLAVVVDGFSLSLL